MLVAETALERLQKVRSRGSTTVPCSYTHATCWLFPPRSRFK